MMYDAAVYQRARADGQRAQSALRLAQFMAKPKVHVALPGEQAETIEQDGFTIRATASYDEGMTLDDLGYGTFEDGVEDWRTGYWHATSPDAVPNPNRDSRNVSGGRRFYIPGGVGTMRERAKEFHRAGASRGVAWDMARESIKEELRIVTDDYGPAVYDVTVTAYKAGIKLGSASVGGVEVGWSDITRTSGEEYLSEVAEDIIPEAIEDARESLANLVEA